MNPIQKYILFSFGYGMLRDLYYIPKIKSIDTNYDAETRKRISTVYEPLLGDKLFMAGVGILYTPIFLPFAMYDDINRIQLYLNKENRKHYQDYLMYNLFPYTSFSARLKGCFDKNVE